MMNEIMIYGFSGARDAYRVVRYEKINRECFGSQLLALETYKMKRDYPSIEEVYWVDNRVGLRADYMKAFRKNSIESWAIFKDLISHEGFKA